MGLFDIFRRAPEKKKEEETRPEEIAFSKILEWLDTELRAAYKEAGEKIAMLKPELEDTVKTAEQNLKAIEDSDFGSENVIERARNIMQGNKKIYVQKTRTFLKSVALPENIDDVPGFCNEFFRSAQELGAGTARNRYITQEFFKKGVSMVSANIKSIHSIIERIRKVTEESGIEQKKELRREAENTLKKTEQKKQLRNDARKSAQEMEKKKKEIAETEEGIKNVEESKEYKDILASVEKKKGVERDIEGLKENLQHAFSEISPAVNRFERITEDSKLIKAYAEDAFAAMLADEHLRILEAIEKMRALIEKGGLELNEKKKEHVLVELRRLNREFFRQKIDRHLRLSQDLKELSREIEASKSIKELERLKNEASRGKERITALKAEIEDIKKKESEIDSEALRQELEKRITAVLDKSIKITS